MMLWYYIVIAGNILLVTSYQNDFSIINSDEKYIDCGNVLPPIKDFLSGKKRKRPMMESRLLKDEKINKVSEKTMMQVGPVKQNRVAVNTKNTSQPKDPFVEYQKIIDLFLFGKKREEDYDSTIADTEDAEKLVYLSEDKIKGSKREERLLHYPTGKFMRSELFNNKSSVHFPPSEMMHCDHALLRVTDDYMQTAVDAFGILVYGRQSDVLKLPPDYVLRSARTIATMKIAREKMVATWTAVKAGRSPMEIPYTTLEMYKPLFKYLNGREIARLNLSDDRILTYIGTHPELDRLQVGVVASKYIQMNPRWNESRYLNLMNNLLCGVPMVFMRKFHSSVYLQLTQQTFYHIRACDPMQRRFYLSMMTRTEALGKSYSWSARDVSRLGLLLAEVEGPDLSSINPEAMSGITSQVMLEMAASNLQHFTNIQVKYLGLKPANILVRKLKAYQDDVAEEFGDYNCAVPTGYTWFFGFISLLSQISYFR